MTISMPIITVVAATSIALIPILVGYRGCFSSKVSGFGFSAEVSVDGRSDQEDISERRLVRILAQVNPLPRSGRSEAERVDGE